MADLTDEEILGNRYRITGRIGAGGGAVTYRAWDLKLQTEVVVKKMKDEIGGKIKSRQEADILKALKHPCLPRVHDFIQTENGVYTILDLIHGRNLDEAVRLHGKYSQNQVKKWAVQLGGALDYLHGQTPPIIHSDIKPANVMLTEDGQIFLIDFNISLAIDGAMGTAVGVSKGFSPPEQYPDLSMYMRIVNNHAEQDFAQLPPEEDATEILIPKEEDDKTEVLDITGSGSRNGSNDDADSSIGSNFSSYIRLIGKGIDTSSDIYSLGATLYFALTGVVPPIDFFARLPVSECGVPVSEGFAIVLNKMMELSPQDRYRNGGEYLKAVKNCHKLDRRYIAMHRKQRKMQAAALGCMAAGILLAFGGLYKISRERNSAYYGTVQQAREVMNQFNFDEAGRLFDEAEEMSQEKIDAYEGKVNLLYLRGDYAECIRLGKNYIDTIPFRLETDADRKRYGNLCYIVANAYFEMKDYPNAVNLFEYALRNNGQDGFYYRDYAIALAKNGEADSAKEQLARGIELGISQASAYMVNGEIACAKGKYEEAAADLNEAVGMADDMQTQQRAVLLCADVYETMGEEALGQEIALLEQYADKFEGNGNRNLSECLADAYTRKAQTDGSAAEEYNQKALALLESLYDSGHTDYQIQQNIAILYEDLGRLDDAKAFLLQMAKAYPERYETYKMLAYLEEKRQQIKENTDRNYKDMFSYYEMAQEKYPGQEQDLEMEMLDHMIQDLRDGGWIG